MGLARSSTPQVSFEEYSETNDAQKVNLLRSQLAIVDRYVILSCVECIVRYCYHCATCWWGYIMSEQLERLGTKRTKTRSLTEKCSLVLSRLRTGLSSAAAHNKR